MKKQTMQAYSDACGVKGDRNLHFKAPRTVSVTRAAEIMRQAVPDSYNEFTADLIDKIGTVAPKARVTLAREMSVCLYLKDSKESLQKVMDLHDENALRADECDLEPDGTLRLWWD
jgi:hypothetical protein